MAITAASDAPAGPNVDFQATPGLIRPHGRARSPGDPGAARRHRLPDGLRVAGEQGLMVTDEKRDTMKYRCRHMPPRLRCALRATQARAAGRNLNLVYTQINEHTLLIRTLRPLRPCPQESQGTKQRRSLCTFTGLSAGLSCSQTSPQVLLTADSRPPAALTRQALDCGISRRICGKCAASTYAQVNGVSADI
jgi:hypothetical protein